ncbi:hypothetical protein CDAR_62841 [Caerostris darwini]|uniref:Uncharacterized protein n=1 Tax=Caerostris darwini TaxID=1538125 RepID=A0AAV4UFC2_9ARAC|nr:hypothetical protein CDAR_62841 [Caerostris darwini]
MRNCCVTPFGGDPAALVRVLFPRVTWPSCFPRITWPCFTPSTLPHSPSRAAHIVSNERMIRTNSVVECVQCASTVFISAFCRIFGVIQFSGKGGSTVAVMDFFCCFYPLDGVSCLLQR